MKLTADLEAAFAVLSMRCGEGGCGDHGFQCEYCSALSQIREALEAASEERDQARLAASMSAVVIGDLRERARSK